MFKSLDLQKTPWKDLGPRNLAHGRIGSRGGRCGPASGELARRRRGPRGGGGRGDLGLPLGGFGVS